MSDDVDENENMELDSPKTPLFKYIKKKMKYSGNDKKIPPDMTSVNDSKSETVELKDPEYISLGTRLDKRRQLIQVLMFITYMFNSLYLIHAVFGPCGSK